MLLSFALLAAYPAGQEGPREPEQFLTKYLGFSHDQILQVFLSSALLLASYLGPVGVKTDSELAKPRKKVTIAAPEGQHEVAVPSGYSTARTGTMLDFDYIQGGWTTRQRRLKARGAGSNEWEEFPGNLSIPLYLGGMATVDELYFQGSSCGYMSCIMFLRKRFTTGIGACRRFSKPNGICDDSDVTTITVFCRA